MTTVSEYKIAKRKDNISLSTIEKSTDNTQQIVIYEGKNNLPEVDVRFEGDTAWLTQTQLANLYSKSPSTISEHIKHIYEEGELQEADTMTTKFGNPEFNTGQPPKYYNLDMIISVGYRVNSKTATAFRQWATARLKEYLQKGFLINDEFLKNQGGGNYFKELLARIRDIRSSEKALYRQVLDLYATSTDYNPKSLDSIEFFKIVQNKFHYAAHQQTAAEVIYNRADANKDFMGLTVFKGDLPVLEEVRIAKNYLTPDELNRLGRLVSAYFDLAELRAEEHQSMSMKDHLESLDKILDDFGKGILTNAGSVSHNQAMDKAETEYRKYQVKTLSKVESDYLEILKSVEQDSKHV
jgi:hypothetical protein